MRQFNLTLVTIKLAEAVRWRAPMYLHCDNGGLQHLEWDVLVGIHATIVDGLERSVFLLGHHTSGIASCFKHTIFISIGGMRMFMEN